nr:MLP-like protein 43 [Tanacetum cinerariifolium]
MTVYKVIGGELVDELYKSFTIILHVEPNGEGRVATLTLEFEKPDTSVPYLTSMMVYLCDLVKDFDEIVVVFFFYGLRLRFTCRPRGNGIDVVVLVDSIPAISKCFANTAYGFFLEKKVAYPVVANYVRNT